MSPLTAYQFGNIVPGQSRWAFVGIAVYFCVVADSIYSVGDIRFNATSCEQTDYLK